MTSLRPFAWLILAACTGGTAGRRPVEEKAEGRAPPAPLLPPDAAIVTPVGALAPYGLASLEHAGSVRGQVTLASGVAVPAPPSGQDACGVGAASSLRVGNSGGVGDTLVWLADIKRGKAPGEEALVEVALHGCRVVPGLALAARVDAELQVRNDDPVRHEVVVDLAPFQGGTPERIADIPMPLEGGHFAVAMPHQGIAHVSCALHPLEQGSVVIPPHPYYTVTDGEGHFVLPDVPPGRYRVAAWHAPTEADGAPLRAEGVAEVAADGSTEAPLVLAR